MAVPLFETENLEFSYNSRQSRPSLDNINIAIHKGVRAVVLGANGAGKSTLFYQLNGVLKPKKGVVKYNGKPIDYSQNSLYALRNEVCVAVQNPDEQIFSVTVEEDIAFGLFNTGVHREIIDKSIDDALFKVGMAGYRKKPVSQISKGQRKRVALAGAFAVNPKVLILDEPTAGLDPQTSCEVMEAIDQISITGTSVIISTHDVDLAYAWADEIYVLKNGKMIYSGEPGAFFSDKKSVISAELAIPHSFSVNSYICSMRGESETPYPRTDSQVICKILPSDAKVGKIRLIRTSKSVPDIGKIDERIGIYGFNTRRLFMDSGLPVDYNFNAVEHCIIEALNGNNVTLCCDECIADKIDSRIKSLSQFGKCPEVI